MLTTFIIICAIFSLIAILFVAIPLWRGKPMTGEADGDRREAILAILRQQAADLERDREAGRIDNDEPCFTIAQGQQPLTSEEKAIAQRMLSGDKE